MQSMTGYGRAEYNEGGISLVVEVKTVNNRYLDVSPRYPRSFMRFEDMMRKLVAKKLSRGRVDLSVSLKETEEAARPVAIDKTLAKSYLDAATALSEEFPALKNDMTVVSLLRFPDVIVQETDDAGKYETILSETLSAALDDLNRMRAVEGEKLKEDIISRNKAITVLVDKIAERAPLVKEDYYNRLVARMKEILGEVDYDQARLLQETAIYADKSNIDEELTRLRSHIRQLYKLVEQPNSGKHIDFLIQEFNRETNTVCSKSNDVEITDLALKLKCEIEKIREQIQNIE